MIQLTNLITINNLNSGMTLPLSEEGDGSALTGTAGASNSGSTSKRSRTAKRTEFSEDELFKRLE